MELPDLLQSDVATMKTVDAWNAELAAMDTGLKIVAGASTVIQLSDRPRIF